jgi:DNA-binding protein HU-beta
LRRDHYAGTGERIMEKNPLHGSGIAVSTAAVRRSLAAARFAAGVACVIVTERGHGRASTKDAKRMSKAFLAQVLQDSASLTGTAATRAAGDLMDAIVKQLKKDGKFTLPSFGTFTVRKTKARKGLNPRTGEAIKVKAGKTVRFKASPTLKSAV